MNKLRGIALAAMAMGIGTLATAEARATLAGSPAMIAWAGHYNAGQQPSGGPLCHNNPDIMPIARQFQSCQSPVMTKTATGRYTVTVVQGAPFTSAAENGYQVFVQAIGTNAHCFEDSTTWQTSGNYTLTSKVRCVAPSAVDGDAVDVDSEWAWSYRVDNVVFPQDQDFPNSFAYARVSASGSIVADQTFNPNTTHVVTSSKISTGRYSVVFKDLYANAQEPVFWADPGYLNNVIVQKTCAGDSATSCRRSVCIPYSWSPGHFVPSPTGNVLDSTLEVRCYGPDGAVRDTSFRAFAGDESHNSQMGYSDMYSSGWQYGWLNYVSSSSNVCHDPSDYLHRAQHESATSGVFSEPMELCKTATGRYNVNLLGGLSLYHADDLIPVVSSKATGGTYCNTHQVVFNTSGTDQLKVRCYTRTGAAVNASWNLSFYY